MAARFAGARAVAVKHARQREALRNGPQAPRRPSDIRRSTSGNSFLGTLTPGAEELPQEVVDEAESAVAKAVDSVHEQPGLILARFGFETHRDAWAPRHLERLTEGAQPQLTVEVTGHREALGHTWYGLQCQLRAGEGLVASWTVQRRLVHLRSGLRDPLQELTGVDYEVLFREAPFALRGGLQGTTARLRDWFLALGRGVNSGVVPPRAVALLLIFSGAPAERQSVKALAAANAQPMQRPESPGAGPEWKPAAL